MISKGKNVPSELNQCRHFRASALRSDATPHENWRLTLYDSVTGLD